MTRPACLLASLLLASAALAAPVTEVRIEGCHAVDPATVTRALLPIVRAGDEVADPQVLIEPIRQTVLRLGFFSDVRVSTPEADGGLRILVTVTERTRIARVDLIGVSLFPDEDVRKLLSTRPGVFMDPQVAQRDAQRIENLYAEAGHIAVVTDVDGTDQGVVTFAILESRVEAFRFEGLHAVTPAEAAAHISLPPDAPYDADQVAAAVAGLGATGWFSAVQIALAPSDTDPAGHLIVRVLLAERPGVFPERIGTPLPGLDPARLRAEISTLPLDLRYAAALQVDEYLLELEGDLPEATLRVGALARGVDPASATPAQADALLSYAQALNASYQPAEALAQYKLAAAAFARLAAAAPQTPELALKLARSQAGAGDRPQALATLRALTAASPDFWPARCLLAQVAAHELLDAAAQAREAASDPLTPGSPRALAVAAVARLLPWEAARAAALAALGVPAATAPGDPLAAEAAAAVAESLRLAPTEPRAWRLATQVIAQALVEVLGALPAAGEVWAAVAEETDALIGQTYDMARLDPGLALWSAYVQSPRALLVLTGQQPPADTGAEVAAEFRALGDRLTTIGRRWAHAPRAAGGLVGVVHFMAGDDTRALADFEALVAQNPRHPDAYNALIGLAYAQGDWTALESVLRRKIERNPALEDYLLLGKSAERQGKLPEALALYQQAAAAYPQRPEALLCSAAVLLRGGGQDADAAAMLDRADALGPAGGYSLALRTVLALLQGDSAAAAERLRAAFTTDPTDDLANYLRAVYFTPTQALP